MSSVALDKWSPLVEEGAFPPRQGHEVSRPGDSRSAVSFERFPYHRHRNLKALREHTQISGLCCFITARTLWSFLGLRVRVVWELLIFVQGQGDTEIMAPLPREASARDAPDGQDVGESDRPGGVR